MSAMARKPSDIYRKNPLRVATFVATTPVIGPQKCVPVGLTSGISRGAQNRTRRRLHAMLDRVLFFRLLNRDALQLPAIPEPTLFSEVILRCDTRGRSRAGRDDET